MEHFDSLVASAEDMVPALTLGVGNTKGQCRIYAGYPCCLHANFRDKTTYLG